MEGSVGAFGSYNTFFAIQGTGSISAGDTTTVGGNLIYGNKLTDSQGIFVSGNKNIIANNTITGSKVAAIGLYWGFNNAVCFNKITDCPGGALLERDRAATNPDLW